MSNGQGTVLGERIGSAHYYFLTNALGSVVAVINGSGQAVSDRYGYDSYGNTTYASVTVPNPFGYAGGYTDATGLILFGARYYDPTTGRWMQVDPLVSITTASYDYASDDPTNKVDSTGDLSVSGTVLYFTYSDTLKFLYPAALLGPTAFAIAVVALGSILGGPVGTVLGFILDAIGWVGLGGLVYLALQSVVTHKGVYFGVTWNWFFPNIASGTWCGCT